MQLVIRSKASTREFPLDSGSEWKIGRHPDNDIAINDPKASRRHGSLTCEDDVWYFEDLGTGNGTKISSVSIPPNTRVEIKEGDIIEIGAYRLHLVDSAGSGDRLLPDRQTGVLIDESDQTVHVLGDEPALIGRMSVCHIKIDDAGSSRINTEIILEDSKYHIRDLGSSNGTWLNDAKIKKEVLQPGDVVRVGNHRFKFSFADESAVPEETTPVAAAGSSKGMSGCSILSFGLISALVSGAAVYFYMAGNKPPVEEVPAVPVVSSKNTGEAPVEVGKPLILDVPVTLQKTGNVQLARQDIIPFAPGRKVEKVHVKNRQRVQKDDPLVTFELTDEMRSAKKQAVAALNLATQEVAKAESEVAKAEAVLENAEQNLSIITDTHDRSLPVYRNRNLLQKEWDEILVKMAEAEAAVKLRGEEKSQAERSVVQAEEQVVQVQTDLSDVENKISDLTVKANSGGIVHSLDLKEGYTVTSINSSMQLIEYEEEVKGIVSVSEDDIGLIRDNMEVDVWLPRAPQQVSRGTVVYIPPTAVNRNYEIEVLIPNRQYSFRPGQQVSVRFITETRHGAILVPPSAVDTDSRNGYRIFTVDPVTQIAELIPVKRLQEITHENQKYIEIVPVDDGGSILREDLIVFKGNRAVKDGMKVLIRNAAPK